VQCSGLDAGGHVCMAVVWSSRSGACCCCQAPVHAGQVWMVVLLLQQAGCMRYLIKGCMVLYDCARGLLTVMGRETGETMHVMSPDCVAVVVSMITPPCVITQHRPGTPTPGRLSPRVALM
jgi:hypothetical protein